MTRLWRNRRTISPVAKELGCGLVTVIVFTLPLWALSAATRGPRFALAMLVGMLLVLAALAVVTRIVRSWRRP